MCERPSVSRRSRTGKLETLVPIAFIRHPSSIPGSALQSQAGPPAAAHVTHSFGQ